MSVIVRKPNGTIKLFCKGAVRACVMVCVGGCVYTVNVTVHLYSCHVCMGGVVSMCTMEYVCCDYEVRFLPLP